MTLVDPYFRLTRACSRQTFVSLLRPITINIGRFYTLISCFLWIAALASTKSGKLQECGEEKYSRKKCCILTSRHSTIPKQLEMMPDELAVYELAQSMGR
jgi:hypothetical protein